jgi:hypothetical protein
MKTRTLVTLLLTLGFYGCNSDNVAPAGAAAASVSAPPQGHQVFIAHLQPLNPDWNAGKVSGVATFLIDGDSFTADVKMQGMGGPFPHFMLIHEGAICPTQDPAQGADANGDGAIDDLEGTQFYGRSLLALAPNIAAPNADLKTFASTDDQGFLDYHAVASYNDVINELRGEGVSDLNLATRTLVLYGVVETSLPETAFHFPAVSASQSLPIACAPIKTVSLAE